MKKICIFQKKAVPLHPLSENEGWTESFGAPENMVVIAQLAEHRIVVPSVVGSSPTLHPEESHPTLFFVFIYARVNAFLLYILYENARFTRFHWVEYTYFCLFPLLSPKIAKIPLLIIRHLQRKCIFFEIFLQKYLVNSKICCTFASAFAQKTGNPQEREQ